MRGASSELAARWPAREEQWVQLSQLLSDPGIAIPLLLHGPSGGGKSGVLRDVLDHYEIPTAYIDCIARQSDRGIFESTLNQLAQHQPRAANNYTNWSVCDSPASFIAGLRQLASARGGRACIVLDKAERLSNRTTFLRILLSLPNLCAGSAAINIVLVAETPFPMTDFQLRELATELQLLRIYFPGYTQSQMNTVLQRDARSTTARLLHVDASPQTTHKLAGCSSKRKNSKWRDKETPAERRPCLTTANSLGASDLMKSSAGRVPIASGKSGKGSTAAQEEADTTSPSLDESQLSAAFDSFVVTFVDFFSAVCRDTHELRHLVRELFPFYIQPALKGMVELNDTRKLLQEALPLLKSSLRRVYARDGEVGSTDADESRSSLFDAALEMPYSSKYLLIAGYLASHFPRGMDVKLFSAAKRASGSRRGRRPAAADESHSFTVERLLAIFDAIQADAQGPGQLCAELLIQLSSLIHLQLLRRNSNEELLDGVRLRCDVPFEIVDAVARSVRFDLRQYQEICT